MLTATKIISLITNLNWKNEDHAKSKIFIKEIKYKDYFQSIPQRYTLGREFTYSFFNPPKTKIQNNDLITNVDIYTTDTTIDFISLFFNYDSENIKNKDLIEIDAVVYLKNGSYTRLPAITKGKKQILECVLTKMEQERSKKQKRDSVKNKKVKQQVAMALNSLA